MYDDFSRGKLRDLLVLEIPDRHPRRVATAESCVIRTAPERPGEIFFEMEDASLYHFGPNDYPKGEPGTSERMTLRVAVAPERRDIHTDEKHLPTLRLLRRLRRLKRRATDQRRFEHPDRVRRETRKKLRVLSAEIVNINGHIESNQADYHKYAVVEVQSHKETIKHHGERIETLRRELDSLQQQQREVVEKLSEIDTTDSGEEAHTDYERWAELNRQLTRIRSQIETHENEIEKLEAEIAQARHSIDASASKAEQLRTETTELKAHKETLVRRSQALRAVQSWADDQQDLISVRLRIHKRLAQAVSLVVFALLGIPLGIMAGGRSIMVAFGISFAIVLVVFYPFLIVGQIAAKAAVLPVVPAMWAGNIFVGMIGLVVMVKVLRS
jgi:predicted  nucleic acid-binding Zn-ribbon protein